MDKRYKFGKNLHCSTNNYKTPNRIKNINNNNIYKRL